MSSNIHLAGVSANTNTSTTFHYSNKAVSLQHIVSKNSHVIQKLNELHKTIDQMGLKIKEINISFDGISHGGSTRYLCKISFGGSSITSYSNTKEGDHYIEITIAVLNEAIRYIRDTKSRSNDIDNKLYEY
jgi:hypothetical protein